MQNMDIKIKIVSAYAMVTITIGHADSAHGECCTLWTDCM